MRSQKTKWHFNVKRPLNLIDASLAHQSDLDELVALTGKGYSQCFFILNKGQVSYYTPIDEVKALVKLLVNNNKNTEKLLRDYKFYKTKLKNSINSLNVNIKNKKFHNDKFKEFFKVYRQFITYRVSTRIIGYDDSLPKNYYLKVGQLRMKFKDDWTVFRQELDKIWLMVARHHQVSTRAIKSLTYREFLDCLDKKSFKPAHKISKQRDRKLIYYKSKKEEYFLFGKEVENFIKKSIDKVDTTKIDIIKGHVACPGYAKGSVKNISKPKKMKTKEKFILVTSMTTPAYVPLLKNVKAIITDEGGLTCHAAIISRELKIPCIIGTKIATQVLKDGDKVEVDANKGIVRKID